MPRHPSAADIATAVRIMPRPVTVDGPLTAYCVPCKQVMELIQPEMTSLDNNRWKGYCSKGHIMFRVA